MTDILPGAKLMQVVEWGYPKGSLRTIDSTKAFSVIHITANLATAENEAAWRIRDTALQNSATFFNNRDGSPVQLLGDPLRMDPWANGFIRGWDAANPRIAAVIRDRVNPNERTLLAIENVGNEIAWGRVPGGYPITSQQEQTCARQIAYYHPKAGVPINRETVVGHYQIDGEQRKNCPARDKAIIDRIVARARALATQEDDMQFWKPVQEDWWTVAKTLTALGTVFYDGAGNKKEFDQRVRVRSTDESSDGRYRLVRYGANERLVVDARLNDKEGPGLTPIRGTRIPATGYGFSADADTTQLEAALDSANKRTASVKTSGAGSLRKAAQAERDHAAALEAAAKNLETL